jgi:predicted ATP-binding protein involved in virulence
MTFHWDGAGKSSALPFRNCVAYGPSLSLRFVEELDLAQRNESPSDNALGFDSTVNNERVQAWLARLYAKRALAANKGEPAEYYRQQLESLKHAVSNAFDEQVGFDIDHKSLQPIVIWRGRASNFSQLPAGIRNIIGWIADFMRRQEMWGERGTTESGVLILDEIDSHLHPRWQRTLLPALREALPKVQIIVATHSPFVISSCKDARIHVLGLDAEGHATKPEIHDALVGSSVSSVLTDIFDVPTEFDVETERQLTQWNELKKAEAAEVISAKDVEQLLELTRALSQKSEELRFLVQSPPRLSRALIEQVMPDKKKGPSAGHNGKGTGRPSGTREKSG